MQDVLPMMTFYHVIRDVLYVISKVVYIYYWLATDNVFADSMHFCVKEHSDGFILGIQLLHSRGREQ